jgi:hypothetical protein
MTSDDRRAQIDRRFDETFAVFDARMRKEQESVSQERAARGGSGSGAAQGGDASGDGSEAAGGRGNEGEGEAGDGPLAGDGAPGGRGAPAGGESDGEGGGGVGGGAMGGSGPNTVPADIPDGRDDDIVARQLREAAMKETDPELRERLWEEYRQYKKSTQ